MFLIVERREGEKCRGSTSSTIQNKQLIFAYKKKKDIMMQNPLYDKITLIFAFIMYFYCNM